MTSTPNQAVVLVVPCYNEAERLDLERFRRYASEHPQVRFLFVDDGSTDATGDLLSADSVGVLTLPSRGGKGEAVRAGMNHARRWQPDLIGFWDADLSTPLEELDGFLEVLATHLEVEMVFGARVGLMGRSIERRLHRHYAGRVFATLVSNALRLPIYDTQCGAKVFRASGDLEAVLAEPFLSRWIFDVEIIARFAALREGAARTALGEIIYELPLHSWRDVGGSKIRPLDTLRIGRDLLRIYSRYLR